MVWHYVLLFLLGLLPSIIWLVFFEQEDKKHPEPISVTVLAFVMGALSTFFALALQVFFNDVLLALDIASRSPLAITVFAAIEEIVKFLAVYLVVRHHSPLREPLDAMIYLITVGLGFAAVENIASVFNQPGGVETILASGRAFEVLVLRFLGATLLHALLGAGIGFHWAIGMIKHHLTGWRIFIGILGAIALHAIFNYLVIRTGPATWAIPFVVIIALFILIDFEELKARDV